MHKFLTILILSGAMGTVTYITLKGRNIPVIYKKKKKSNNEGFFINDVNETVIEKAEIPVAAEISAFFSKIGKVFGGVVEAAKNNIGGGGSKLSAKEIHKKARFIKNLHFPLVDEKMLTTMAIIESSGNVNATRYEAHLNDSSKGLMQVLQSTADWLYSEMRYRSYKPDNLFDVNTSLYFGGAYVDYLRKWRGKKRSEQWVVESYNGGPGNSNSQTQNHYRKYLKMKQQLKNEEVF